MTVTSSREGGGPVEKADQMTASGEDTQFPVKAATPVAGNPRR